ncbi:MAG: hypothetical protein R6X34_11945 [Chloroflexota bacterium]
MLKRSGRIILVVLVLLLGLGLGAFLLRDQPQSQVVQPVEPEYGLVWFGINGRSQKAVSDQPNAYFDPARPTIIYVHGWLPNQVAAPPTFVVDIKNEEQERDDHLDLAAAWVAAGWNVGIFYWHPFADEDLVWVAEDKIWTTEKDAAMRYRDADGNFHTAGMPAVSATVLFYQTYLEAMDGYTGPEIRLAGHSLGNQMAVRLASQLVDGIEAGAVPENLLPSRLALLDPFWSPLPKSYLDGQETGTVIRREIEEKLLPREVLVEWYRSSLLTEETLLKEDVPQFQAQVVYAELAPDFCGALDQVCRHDAAWHLYFLSFGSPAPQECAPDETTASCASTGRQGPMASTANERLAEMMNEPFYWLHGSGPEGENGRSTPQTDDDWFHRLPAPSR